ncbi:MAG: YggT family protein [Ktedonobacterales bacterium]
MGATVQFEPIHFIIMFFYRAMVVLLWSRFILSFLAPSLSNIPFLMRLYVTVSKLTDPLIEPLQRRLPRMSVGMFDIGATVAFIFSWWALGILTGFMISSLPSGW